jgi:hypothetical protein
MNARDVLYHLAAVGPCYTRQIAAALGLHRDTVTRVARCLSRRGLVFSVDGLHGITKAGRERVVEGFNPCELKGRAAASRGRTIRQRAWNVMRMMDTFSAADLLRCVCDGDGGGTEKKAEDNITRYCRALAHAGILGITARTGRYFLRDDTGPLSPAWNKVEKCVTDRNTGKIIQTGVWS